MAIDTERNRVLASLRDQAEGVDSCVLGEHLTLAREVVEHHLLYRVDYDLAKWRRVRSGDHLHDSYDSLDIVINSQTPYGEAVVGAMHLSVRLYEKVSNPREIARHVNETFMPLISAVPGFIAYYFADAGNGTMFSTSIFRDKAGVEESNRVTAEWVKKNPSVLPDATRVTAGEVLGHKVAGEVVGQKV